MIMRDTIIYVDFNVDFWRDQDHRVHTAYLPNSFCENSSGNPYILRIPCMRSSAKQSVKEGLASLGHRGHFNTSLHWNHSSYDDKSLHVWLRRQKKQICQVWFKSTLWRLLHAYVKNTLLVTVLPFFLLFFLLTCSGQTDRDNFTHSGLKDAVWRKEVPSQQVFFSVSTIGEGSFCPKPPKFRHE